MGSKTGRLVSMEVPTRGELELVALLPGLLVLALLPPSCTAGSG